MNTLTLSASRFTYGSCTRLTSTTRPSAADSTAPASAGMTRGGSRKNCRMKTASSQNGSDHHPANQVTSRQTATAMPRNGQPSRAMNGCG
jgi:hypothetical protein